MTQESEVERIARVYHGYKDEGRIDAQWSLLNQGNAYILKHRMLLLSQILNSAGYLPLKEKLILEVGCGTGRELANLLNLGAQPANLYGVDLLAERIIVAQQLYPNMMFRQMNGESLSFDSGSFDLVMLFTVFSSILDHAMKKQVADEVLRVLKKNGAVVWYDFRYNNPYNFNVSGMTRNDICKLFPGCSLRLHPVTLLPPLARRLGFTLNVLYPLLFRIPLLRTHYLGLVTKL